MISAVNLASDRNDLAGVHLSKPPFRKNLLASQDERLKSLRGKNDLAMCSRRDEENMFPPELKAGRFLRKIASIRIHARISLCSKYTEQLGNEAERINLRNTFNALTFFLFDEPLGAAA